MKSCYIISYDLCTPGRDYEGLYKAIKNYGTWAKMTESTWAIVTEQTAAQIRDTLLQNLDINDRLFVMKSGKTAAWRKVKASKDWLRKYIVLGA